MSAPNDGGCAFPCESMPSKGPNGRLPFSPGMTLRDYFAAKAMQGLLAGPQPDSEWFAVGEIENDASFCYDIADAMLKAREAKS